MSVSPKDKLAVPAAMSIPASFRARSSNQIPSVSYDDAKEGKPPIPITVAPTPSSAHLGLHPSLRPSLDGSSAQTQLQDDLKRDSGFTATNSNARDSRTTIATDGDSAVSVQRSLRVRKSPSFMRGNGIASTPPSARRAQKWSTPSTPQTDAKSELKDEVPKLPNPAFLTPPSAAPASISLEDLASPDKVQFSKRGSMLIGGRRAKDMTPSPVNQARDAPVRSRKPIRSAASLTSGIPTRVMSTDEEIMSQKVRSMYQAGADGESITASDQVSDIEGIGGIQEEESSVRAVGRHLTPETSSNRRLSPSVAHRKTSLREEEELAGGIEDWKDVENGDVDRYGFIVPQSSNNASTNSLSVPEPRLHRVSTALQLASEAPRRQRSRLGRTPSNSNSARSASYNRSKNMGLIARPTSSQSSYRSTNSRPTSRMRSAANWLPHNRDRRWVDEAGDMLTLPPGLADIAEQEEGGKAAYTLKKKEWERDEKWRKMAKVVKSNGVGGGTEFVFDTHDPKLIQRTWKGIPDRWRATAWHSFLSASARRQGRAQPSDEELIGCFEELVDQSSPDDVQIDIDVPRTISSHIMFRRRYRGGQRLLFRVLHCLSLYFPDTGYVQGMAALAATFLCYFEERMAFVMLVRMWQLRGLDRLYKSGFTGLMQALDEFEKKWLHGNTVASKLVSWLASSSPLFSIPFRDPLTRYLARSTGLNLFFTLLTNPLPYLE